MDPKTGEGQEAENNTPPVTGEETPGAGGEQNQTPPTNEGDQTATPPQGEATNEPGGPDFSEFQSELEKDGTLSEASYSKLETLGYSKEMVDAYVSGATSGVTEADAAELIEGVGGKEKFDALAEWAAQNLSEQELASYNDALTNKNSARMALEWVQSRHREAEGFSPTVKVDGVPAGTPKADVFTDRKQITEAMRDPRYGSDKAYTKSVEAKVGRSNLF